MSYLEIDNVSVSFGPHSSRTHVLSDINLSVEENEFVAVIGFSGSGKSTLMSLLAGLQEPTTGEVRMDGEVVREPGPDLGLMFQNYSLLPWLTVNENIRLAVKTGPQGLIGQGARRIPSAAASARLRQRQLSTVGA